jgi:hypothetical protein
LYKVESQQKVISQLYSSDLIGGSLGSLIASLIFIPVFGYFFSLLFIAALSLYCLVSV